MARSIISSLLLTLFLSLSYGQGTSEKDTTRTDSSSHQKKAELFPLNRSAHFPFRTQFGTGYDILKGRISLTGQYHFSRFSLRGQVMARFHKSEENLDIENYYWYQTSIGASFKLLRIGKGFHFSVGGGIIAGKRSIRILRSNCVRGNCRMARSTTYLAPAGYLIAERHLTARWSLSVEASIVPGGKSDFAVDPSIQPDAISFKVHYQLFEDEDPPVPNEEEERPQRFR